MGARAVDDKPSDTLVVVPGEGFWTGSSTLPHLHQLTPGAVRAVSRRGPCPPAAALLAGADQDDPDDPGVVAVEGLLVDDLARLVLDGPGDPDVLAVGRVLDLLADALPAATSCRDLG